MASACVFHLWSGQFRLLHVKHSVPSPRTHILFNSSFIFEELFSFVGGCPPPMMYLACLPPVMYWLHWTSLAHTFKNNETREQSCSGHCFSSVLKDQLNFLHQSSQPIFFAWDSIAPMCWKAKRERIAGTICYSSYENVCHVFVSNTSYFETGLNILVGVDNRYLAVNKLY